MAIETSAAEPRLISDYSSQLTAYCTGRTCLFSNAIADVLHALYVPMRDGPREPVGFNSTNTSHFVTDTVLTTVQYTVQY